MGTIAQLNVEIGASLAPLQAGLAAAKGELTGFGAVGEEVFQSVNGSLSQSAQQALLTAKSYAQLTDAVELLINEQNQFAAGTANWRVYQEAINKVDAQLNALDADAQRAGRSLATVVPPSGSLAGATAQFQGLNMMLRETHSLGISTTRGIVSMSAIGFPMLIKEIQMARQEGQGFGSILSTLGGQMFSATAIITLAGSAVAILAHHFLMGKEEIDKYRQAVDGIENSIAKEILSSRALLAVAADENQTREVRLQAVKKLREEYEPYLKGLSDEQILSGQIGDALKVINNALLQKVAMQAGEEKILPILRQQLDLQLKNIELQRTMDAAAGITKDAADKAATSGIKTLGIMRAQATGAKIEFDKNTEAINKLDTEINKMFEGIKGFISGSAALDVGKFTQGKEKVDQVEKAIRELGIALNEIKTKGWGVIKVDQAEISAIESTIKRLRDLGLNDNDSRILAYRVQIDGLNVDVLDEMVKNMVAAENAKLAGDKGEKIGIPVELKFKSPKDSSFSKEDVSLKEYAQKIKDDFKKLGLDAPMVLDYPLLMSKEEMKGTENSEGFLKRKQELETLKKMAGEIGDAFGEVFDTLITKGKLSFDAIGKLIGNLIKQLISAVVEAAVLSLVLNAIFPGSSLAGTSAWSFGGLFKNLSGFAIPHADGFIATGPTMFGNHMIGEKSSGEALIPLNRLSTMIGMGGSQGGRLEARFSRDEMIIWMSRGLQTNNRGYGNNNGFGL
jgi:hypothetical protein